jgi:FkbM family methyltransferase
MKKHFFDIGANDGNTFDLFLNGSDKYKNWNVWCFEPSAKHFASLLNAATRNSDKFNITVCPFGLGGKTEILQFHEMINNTVSDSLFTDVGGTINPNPKYKLVCSIISITEFMENNTSPEDEVVLKVDCEGAEYEIYEDLLNKPELLKRITTIYNEWHPGWPMDFDPMRKNRADQIISRLSENGKTLIDWAF